MALPIRACIIDWETLSTLPTAKVIAVGLTAFDLTVESTIDELRATTESFNIDSGSQSDRHICPDTFEWWTKQSDEAKAALLDNQLNIKEALSRIISFIENHKIQYLVGNGSTFDNAILADLCREHGIDYPVEYWQDMVLRTMKLLAGMNGKAKFPEGLTKHIAADDAIYEAMVAQTCWRRTRSG